jgi:hypothetical protein
VKGPVILLPVMTAAVWVSAKDRSLSWLKALRPLPGLGWMLLLTLPWFIAIMIRTEGAFLMASIGGDLAEKIAATGEHSGIPPGFYLLTVWATLWPWTLLLPLALVTGWTMRKAARGRVPPGLDRAHMGRVRGGLDQAHPLHAAHLPRAPAAGRGPSGAAHRRGARVPGLGRACRDGGFVLGTLAFAVLAIGAPSRSATGIDPLAHPGRAVATLAAFWPSWPSTGARRCGAPWRSRWRDRDGLDPHGASLPRRAGVLDHAADGGGDGDAHLPCDAAGHRRSHAAEHGVPVRHRHAFTDTAGAAFDGWPRRRTARRGSRPTRFPRAWPSRPANRT